MNETVPSRPGARLDPPASLAARSAVRRHHPAALAVDAKTVLLVEDDPEDLFLFQDALRRRGFRHRVTAVKDGAEALDWILARGEHSKRDASCAPDLVVTDLQMPLIGGLELLGALRSHPTLRHLAVVMLTGSDAEREKLEAKRLGASLFLRKPSDGKYDDVAASLDELLA